MPTSKILIAIFITLLLAGLITAAGSSQSVSAFGLPLFAICGVLAFAINWLAFIPASITQTEKYYDLTGGLTYLTVTITAVLLAPAPDARAWLVAGLVIVWALRLASFLFLRIRRDGKDGRFDEIKANPLRFFLTWSLQGLWVLLTSACAIAVITSVEQQPIGWVAMLGLAVWLFGYAVEVIADRQKSAFKKDPANEGKFINTGLWAWARHPNYFGEIVLWIGVAIIALPILSGWQWATLISPVFVIFLLTKVSGIPLLTERAKERWGGDSDFERYMAETPALILKPPKRGA